MGSEGLLISQRSPSPPLKVKVLKAAGKKIAGRLSGKQPPGTGLWAPETSPMPGSTGRERTGEHDLSFWKAARGYLHIEKKKERIGKITCRDTLCGREMIISVYILNLSQNAKSYPDAGKGEHFLHFRNNTQRIHPSVCCKKMSKSHVYQENPKC